MLTVAVFLAPEGVRIHTEGTLPVDGPELRTRMIEIRQQVETVAAWSPQSGTTAVANRRALQPVRA